MADPEPVDTVDVEAVNQSDGLVLLATGEVVPIDTFLDDEGDETDDRDEAVVAVAGPTADGKWLSVALTDFTRHVPS